MSLAQRLNEYVSACFTGLWIESHEHDDALREIAQLCREQNWWLATWDVEQGLRIPGQNNGQSADAGGSDPLAAIANQNGGCQSRRNWGPVSRGQGAKPRADESRRNGARWDGDCENGWRSVSSVIMLE